MQSWRSVTAFSRQHPRQRRQRRFAGGNDSVLYATHRRASPLFSAFPIRRSASLRMNLARRVQSRFLHRTGNTEPEAARLCSAPGDAGKTGGGGHCRWR